MLPQGVVRGVLRGAGWESGHVSHDIGCGGNMDGHMRFNTRVNLEPTETERISP